LPDVAGAQPAVGQLQFGFFRIVPVALHDRGAFNEDFTRLAWFDVLHAVFHIHQPHVVLHDGNADGAGAARQNRIGNAQRRGFTHAPALTVEYAEVFHFPDEFRGHGRAAGIEKTEPLVEVHFFRFGMIHDRRDHGRNGREVSDLIDAFDGAQNFVDVETRHQHLRGCVEHSPVHGAGVAVNVEIGENPQDIAFFVGHEGRDGIAP